MGKELQKLAQFTLLAHLFNENEAWLINRLYDGEFILEKNEKDFFERNIDLNKINFFLEEVVNVISCDNCEKCIEEGIQSPNEREFFSLESDSDVSYPDFEGSYYEFSECESKYTHFFSIEPSDLNEEQLFENYNIKRIYISPELAVENGDKYNQVNDQIIIELKEKLSSIFEEQNSLEWPDEVLYITDDDFEKWCPEANNLVKQFHKDYIKFDMKDELDME
ncbi:hypothetical protein [Williamsoniiplasma lucivorax]|uniref:Uncharacterized protein n=1 Tax=Williamsoniiplasma lucivorax TaxID=209274 RepID=A0A2S5RDG8_9MOLU|nr:hypothetical protein [Williamsoniiplasma lucivorax]PPE05389.1 hypothetical protein ELUCI_v1c04810 [Williamsoniiplasma lucivorax]